MSEPIEEQVARCIYETIFEDRWADASGIERACYIGAAVEVLKLLHGKARQWREAGKFADWWVYSTAVGEGKILVRDMNSSRYGYIDDYTTEEWQEAFYAPSRPYPWPAPHRVKEAR